MYFKDRGIEELDERRGEEQVALGRLAARASPSPSCISSSTCLSAGWAPGQPVPARTANRDRRPESPAGRNCCCGSGETTVLEHPRQDFQAALDVITYRPSRAALFHGRREREAEHHAYHQ